jgi:D-alanyl-D-alanine carboxypeptidase (penicillin-binding protein 5/6)
VESRNRLLRYDWANGIKTGATRASGKCLLGSGRFDLRGLIVVTLREPTREQEVRDAVALFKWADALYERRLLASAGDLVTTVPLADGGEVRAVAASPLTRVVRRAAEVQVEVMRLASPLGDVPEPGARLGTVAFRADGQLLGTIDLVADGTVAPSASP